LLVDSFWIFRIDHLQRREKESLEEDKDLSSEIIDKRMIPFAIMVPPNGQLQLINCQSLRWMLRPADQVSHNSAGLC